MTEERNTAAPETEESRNFILNLIDQDIAEGGQFQGQTVHTRFPPEPNGYLHIGHCKALCIDFGTAEKFGGLCNLRMDDTNPAKEDTEYVDAIQQDIHWLGFDWGDRFFYGSDYFEKDYEYAVELIQKGATRLGFDNITAHCQDAAAFVPQWEQAMDAVIVDAPCSGLGIIRKKPDIRYKDLKPMQELPELQLRILSNQSRYVRPGGVLMYSTCTVLRRENE